MQKNQYIQGTAHIDLDTGEQAEITGFSPSQTGGVELFSKAGNMTVRSGTVRSMAEQHPDNQVLRDAVDFLDNSRIPS